MKATGDPRLALTVGKQTRYATFSGWGSAALYFSYTVQAGDRDEDGIGYRGRRSGAERREPSRPRTA